MVSQGAFVTPTDQEPVDNTSSIFSAASAFILTVVVTLVSPSAVAQSTDRTMPMRSPHGSVVKLYSSKIRLRCLAKLKNWLNLTRTARRVRSFSVPPRDSLAIRESAIPS